MALKPPLQPRLVDIVMISQYLCFDGKFRAPYITVRIYILDMHTAIYLADMIRCKHCCGYLAFYPSVSFLFSSIYLSLYLSVCSWLYVAVYLYWCLSFYEYEIRNQIKHRGYICCGIYYEYAVIVIHANIYYMLLYLYLLLYKHISIRLHILICLLIHIHMLIHVHIHIYMTCTCIDIYICTCIYTGLNLDRFIYCT